MTSRSAPRGKARGATLDTGALIALDRGDPRIADLVSEAAAAGLRVALPAGVIAQAWRGGARQALLARLLTSMHTDVVPLDLAAALEVGTRCAETGARDVVDVSVVVCAEHRGHAVVTSDPGDIRRIEPRVPVVVV